MNQSDVSSQRKQRTTYMVQQLNGHLYIRRLAGDHNQPFTFRSPRSAVCCCTWFHDLYLTSAHVADFVDLAPALADDAADQTVGDVDLLRLHRLRRVVRCAVAWPWWSRRWIGSRNIGGASVLGAPGTRRGGRGRGPV